MPSFGSGRDDEHRMAVYRSGDHALSTSNGSDNGDEDEWVTRRRVEVITTKNIETRVQRQLLVDEDGNVVEDSGPIISTDTTVDTTEKKDENTEHRKSSDRQPSEGRAVVPSGDSVVSERYVNVTNSHEEHESGRREEEVHHLGSVSNEEVQRAIRDGADARRLVQRQVSAGSGGGGAVVDPRAPQRRLLHQHGRSWRTVDTDDLRETSRRDRHGELRTESAHTHQHEEYHDAQVPEDGPDEEAREQVRSSSHSRRHTKDVDMLEHFSVPRGGRLADGIKLGDGLRYVKENVEEQRQGDPETGGVSERLRELHRPALQHSSTSIEYRPGEQRARGGPSSSWLNGLLSAESPPSPRSPEESGRRQTGSSHPETWRRTESYTREVRETPERTYIKETRESPRGGYERVQLVPAGAPRPPVSSAISDLVSEVDEDPIFASKFSSGKSRGGGATLAFTSVPREVERPPSPPAPTAPPRTKRKNRQKQQAPPPPEPPREVTHTPPQRRRTPPQEPRYSPPQVRRIPSQEARYSPPRVRRSSPQETRYSPPQVRRTSSKENRYSPPPVRRSPLQETRYSPPQETRYTPPRRPSAGERDSTPVRVQTTQQEDGRIVKEYHFCSSPRPQRPVRRGSPVARESPSAAWERSRSSDEPDGPAAARLGGLVGRRHQSTEQLDWRAGEPPFSTQTVDRRRPARPHQEPVLQTQTLPRKPRESRDPPSASRLGASSKFGGSMINVSVRNNVFGSSPVTRQPPRRTNSLYEKEEGPAGGGLKSPDIISAIQRTSGTRREEDDDIQRQSVEKEPEWRPTVSAHPPPPPPPPPPAKVPKVAPKVAPKPRPATKENFMRGLMQNAPELYSALHGDERKDSKTPSPKQSPPPALYRARSPAPLTLDYGAIYPKTPPVFKRLERLRADEEVVTKEGRSRSTTPAEDVHNFRLGTMSPTGERTDLIKVQR